MKQDIKASSNENFTRLIAFPPFVRLKKEEKIVRHGVKKDNYHYGQGQQADRLYIGAAVFYFFLILPYRGIN